MKRPDERAFEMDVEGADFQIGLVKGMWGFSNADTIPDQIAWPEIVLWVAAAPRPNSPVQFHLKLNLADYRNVAPTGAFWDPIECAPLPSNQWPKGVQNSRVAKVFRTDWNNCLALYHPYDRVAANGHAEWP